VLIVVVGTAAMSIWSAYVYVVRERLGLEGLGLAALRTIGVAALLLLLVNPGGVSRSSDEAAVVLLDASLSMEVGRRWSDAVDTATALAGSDGTIMRFGSSVTPFDTTPPDESATRLRSALVSARALGGPVYVVTDGEIEDWATILPSLLEDVALVVLPRDTLPDAALLDVKLPHRVQRTDSLAVDVTLGMWGTTGATRPILELSADGRLLAALEVEAPPSPSVIRRRLTVAPNALRSGVNLLIVRVLLDGDSIPVDDERIRVVMVSEQPEVVVAIDSPDWEGRFLASELQGLVGSGVRAYVQIRDDDWLETQSGQRVSTGTVRRIAARSRLLVLRGSGQLSRILGMRTPHLWEWPAEAGHDPTYSTGDWYPTSPVPPSPLAAYIGFAEWDSLPPLLGVLQRAPAVDGWVALSARLGRRGAALPVVVGRDSAGVRSLTTTGSGLWRWAFRGGASGEAYRALLASGVNWLLGSDPGIRTQAVLASDVVARGEPTVFTRGSESMPESVTVDFRTLSGDSSWSAMLRFDGQGNATQYLPPGAYRWSASDESGSSGVAVVEEYSGEYAPRRAGVRSGGSVTSTTLVEIHARDRWLLFVIVVLALAGEWGWRHRRGLP
jgi:hypothetical protein